MQNSGSKANKTAWRSKPKRRNRNNVALGRFRCILAFAVKLKYSGKVLVYIATEKVMKIIEPCFQ